MDAAPVRSQAAAAERHRQIRRVLVLTLLANLAVVVAKLASGLVTDTLSVVADGVHSTVDASNNLVALVMARLAAKGPDEKHPYGHAKFETLGALAVVAFLSITVFELLAAAVNRLLGAGAEPDATPLVFAVMAASAVMSLFVSRYEEAQGRALGSPLLIADAAHTRSDVYASMAVLAGLALVRAGFAWADPVVTLALAAVIARAGWQILRSVVPTLVDERAADAEAIRAIARGTEGVIDVYDIRSRGRPGSVFAELTVSVPGGMEVEQAHRIADEVERRVADELNAQEVVAHVEPAHPATAPPATVPARPAAATAAPPARRVTQVRLVLGTVLAVNILVVIAKAVAGLISGALSVTADAVHSAVDASHNVIGLALVGMAAAIPDERHPYGHEKYETLGAIAVVAFLSITVFELAGSALGRLVTDAPPPRVGGGVAAVIALSAVLSGTLSVIERRRGEKLRSQILVADASHTRADLYSSLTVLAGLVLASLGARWADPLFTLVVSGLIGLGGWRILRETVPVLVDERAVDENVIARIATSTPGVLGCHAIRSRGRPGDIFAEFTITVEPEMDVIRAHEIADAVEHRVRDGVGARDVVAHIEPHHPPGPPGPASA